MADKNVCACSSAPTHTCNACMHTHTHTHTHKQGSWHMVYQQAQFFCPLASFSNTTTLGTRQAFVLNMYDANIKAEKTFRVSVQIKNMQDLTQYYENEISHKDFFLLFSFFFSVLLVTFRLKRTFLLEPDQYIDPSVLYQSILVLAYMLLDMHQNENLIIT